MLEVRSQGGGITLCKTPSEFLHEIVSRRRHRASVALRIAGTALVDIIAQPVVKIPLFQTLFHLALVVELDLVDQQPRETLRSLMGVGIGSGHRGRGQANLDRKSSRLNSS